MCSSIRGENTHGHCSESGCALVNELGVRALEAIKTTRWTYVYIMNYLIAMSPSRIHRDKSDDCRLNTRMCSLGDEEPRLVDPKVWLARNQFLNCWLGSGLSKKQNINQKLFDRNDPFDDAFQSTISPEVRLETV